jgi:MFS family permease
LLLHATDLQNRAPFLFDQTSFDTICSDRDSFRLSEAVAASAAVPVLFAPVILRNYRDGCSFDPPPIPAAAPPSALDTHLRRTMARYGDLSENRYIKLNDGGLVDNLGTLGLILAAGALLGVGVGAMSGRLGERIGSFGLCLLGAIGLAVLTALLAFPLPIWAIAAGIMGIGPLFPLLMTGIYPLVASTSDDLGVAHGTANGVINIFWTGATAIVPLAAAQIADAFGDAAAYSTAAALTALLIAIAVVMRSRARNLSLSH